MIAVTACRSSPFVRRLAPIGVAVALAAPALQAQQILAPDALVGGLSQSYLSAKSWSWALLFPAESNPIITGDYSAVVDQGPYFMLAGTLDGSPVTRTVTIRNDQVLFFALGSIASMIPFFGLTEAEIRADARDNLGTLTSAAVTFDGAPAVLAAGTASFSDYRQLSPLFPLTFAPGNIFGMPVGVFDAVADGWYVAMAPLGDGAHTLRFTSTYAGQGAYDGMIFSQDNTYHINVVPEAGSAAMLGAGLAVLMLWTGRRRLESSSGKGSASNSWAQARRT